MVNVANINRLIQRIRDDEGKHTKMLQFAQYLDDPEKVVDKYVHCNTAFCLCGHIHMMMLTDKGVDPKALDGEFRAVMAGRNKAAHFIGIEDKQVFPLFEMTDCRDFGLQSPLWVFDALPDKQRADAAIRVLEILRDSGEVDWSRALAETTPSS